MNKHNPLYGAARSAVMVNVVTLYMVIGAAMFGATAVGIAVATMGSTKN